MRAPRPPSSRADGKIHSRDTLISQQALPHGTAPHAATPAAAGGGIGRIDPMARIADVTGRYVYLTVEGVEYRLYF
ncbi:MAG TPA: hypothetical protein VM684_04350, partial [Gaiellales bacterium]|nr:hypothetical protein [Gaiellales bacterium]